jgi:DNA-binding MarR family transcriptional regulator
MPSELLGRWRNALIDYIRSGEPDLNNRQMALLLIIYASPGRHTVRGLAEKLQVSRPVVTRALNTLSALGYLRRERDESDGRNIFITQTPNGARFLERFEKFLGRDRPTGSAARLERANTA